MFRTSRPLLALVIAFSLSGGARAGQLELLSRAAVESDTAGGGSLIAPLASSADGRWIAFASSARNLVPGQVDPFHFQDVFLHDRDTGTNVLVSHAQGAPSVAGIGTSNAPSISADGRWIAYRSQAGNLVPGQDTFPAAQVFLYDRDTGTNTLVTHSTAGPSVESAGSVLEVQVSADGNWIAFTSDGTDLVPGLTVPVPGQQLYLAERATGEITLVSRAAGTAATASNGFSETPSLSEDGRYLAFRSAATDLVPGFTDGDVNERDVFLFDRVTGAMTLVSHPPGSPAHGAGGRSPAVSADGSTVIFLSRSAGLVSGQTDTNSSQDLFLFDRGTGTSVLVSRSAASPTTAGNAGVRTDQPRVSDDGAWVAFVSDATNAVPGQVTTGVGNVFLFERATSSLTLVSRSSASAVQAVGGSFPSLSADGSVVAFDSLSGDVVAGQQSPPPPPGLANVFLYDRTTGTNVLASGAGGSGQVTGNGYSADQVLSADGSVVAFRTSATDLVAGVTDLNLERDVAIYDREGETVALATLHPPGMASATPAGSSLSASVSEDGRYAVLLSLAPNLQPGVVQPDGSGLQVYLVDRETGSVALVSHSASSPTAVSNARSRDAVISADGAWILFNSLATDLVPGQVDGSPWGTSDVFLYERATGTVTLVSHAAGTPTTAGNAGCSFDSDVGPSPPARMSISADGSYAAYECLATDLVAGQTDANAEESDIFLYDRVTGQNSLVSRSAASAVTTGNSSSSHPAISPDGGYVTFSSFATDLVAGGTDANNTQDIFLFDRAAGQTLLVSRAAGTAATAANDGSGGPKLNGDGRYVVFNSSATDLVPGQTDLPPAESDVFLFDRVTGTVELISRAPGSSTLTGNDTSRGGVPSADGRYVLFSSRAWDLVPGQAEPGQGTLDLFVHDRVTRTTELITHAASSPVLASDGNVSIYTLSPNGRSVAFLSTASNLAAGSAGFALFVADRELRTLERVTVAPWFTAALHADVESSRLLSGDGSTVFFATSDTSLAANDFNGSPDAFAYVLAKEPEGSDFFTLTPCRLLDTRLPEDGPALVSDHPELLAATGACGIPETAKALALNVTVVDPQNRGRLTVHPGNLQASTSTLNFAAGETRSNNAIVALATNGERTLGITPFVLGGGTVHVVVDVSGYFE